MNNITVGFCSDSEETPNCSASSVESAYLENATSNPVSTNVSVFPEMEASVEVPLIVDARITESFDLVYDPWSAIVADTLPLVPDSNSSKVLLLRRVNDPAVTTIALPPTVTATGKVWPLTVCKVYVPATDGSGPVESPPQAEDSSNAAKASKRPVFTVISGIGKYNPITGGYPSVTEQSPNQPLPQAVQQQYSEGQGNHPQQVPDIPQQGQDGGVIDNAYRAGEIPAMGWTVYRGGHRLRARDHAHNPTTTETFRKIPRLVTSNPSYNAAMMGTGATPMFAFRRRSVSAVRGNRSRFRVPVLVDLNTPANTQNSFNNQGADLHPLGKDQWRYTSVQNRRQVSFAHAHTSAFHKYAHRSMPKNAPMDTQWIQGPTQTAAAVIAIARFRYTRIPATVRTNRCPAMGWCA